MSEFRYALFDRFGHAPPSFVPEEVDEGWVKIIKVRTGITKNGNRTQIDITSARKADKLCATGTVASTFESSGAKAASL